jgi:hypothetical protein
MRFSLALFLFWGSLSAHAQKPGQILFDSLRSYAITYEDSLIDIWGKEMNIHENKTVNADLRIPGDFGGTEINFVEAILTGDTLKLEFHGYPGHTVETFRIAVVKDKYWSYYNFRDDGDFVSKMIPKKHKLALNSPDYKKGYTIKGYTEYIGKCRNCKVNKIIEIKGSFKVLIQ